MLSVTFQPFMLAVVMVNVIMLRVVILNVVAPKKHVGISRFQVLSLNFSCLKNVRYRKDPKDAFLSCYPLGYLTHLATPPHVFRASALPSLLPLDHLLLNLLIEKSKR